MEYKQVPSSSYHSLFPSSPQIKVNSSFLPILRNNDFTALEIKKRHC
jgi:hypothetical protein